MEKARSGKYADAIAADVSPERLTHYFVKIEGGYQIRKLLREMCVFSRHDLIQDPPFSKMDLISCRNGAEIVRQLMIYAGQENDVVELVDISAMVKDMLELLKVSVSKHAAVETALGKALPAVRANPARLRQIVMNLVTNASEAIGDRDGVIRVTTRVVTVGRDSPVANSERLREGDYLQLEVSDTGCGMTTDMQGRIFDPFFTTKPAATASGLRSSKGLFAVSTGPSGL